MNNQGATNKHDAIADAVLSLAARKGLEYVSLRHVAIEAGVSMGQIQYYFGTTADLLHFSIKRMIDQLGVLVAARAASWEEQDDPLDPLFALVHALITDDPEICRIMNVLGQYEARLTKDDRIGGLLARNDPSLQAYTVAIFAGAVEAGVLPESVDPVMEAQIYWVLLGSLSVEIALGSSTVARGLELMTYHLTRLRSLHS